jgi:hypothetical protein
MRADAIQNRRSRRFRRLPEILTMLLGERENCVLKRGPLTPVVCQADNGASGHLVKQKTRTGDACDANICEALRSLAKPCEAG